MSSNQRPAPVSIDRGDPESTDAVFGLGALFTGNLPPSCPAAYDVNSDATFDISDVVALLSYLFVPGSPAPSAPFPGCGAPTTSDLPCGGETDCP